MPQRAAVGRPVQQPAQKHPNRADAHADQSCGRGRAEEGPGREAGASDRRGYHDDGAGTLLARR